MRWYLAKDGQVVGPVDEGTIRQWESKRLILPGTTICAEGDNQWTPFERSSFARRRTSSCLVAIALLAGCFAVLLVCAAIAKRDEPKERVAHDVAAQKQHSERDRIEEENQRRAAAVVAEEQREQEALRLGRIAVREHLGTLTPQERVKRLRECFESRELCPDGRGPILLLEAPPTAGERKQLEALWKQLETERDRAAAAARRASAPLLCCDGSLSPSCTCSGPRRGCCSRHGGVCGCSE